MLPALLSIAGVLFGAGLTYILTRRKEHEAEWRKLKSEQYREFLLALSGVVEGRATMAAHNRYADSVNSLMLVAPARVYQALESYLAETSVLNRAKWSLAGHHRCLNVLIHAMRADTDPRHDKGGKRLTFLLYSPPPESALERWPVAAPADGADA